MEKVDDVLEGDTKFFENKQHNTIFGQNEAYMLIKALPAARYGQPSRCQLVAGGGTGWRMAGNW